MREEPLRRAPVGRPESDSPVGGMPVWGEAFLVDNDLMVEPTQHYQVFRICGSSVGPMLYVMYLEPVAALTAVSSTGVAVSFQNGPA